MSGFSGFRTSLTLIQRRKSPCLSWRWLERLWKNRSAYRAAMPQNKNRLKKMDRVRHNNFRLSKLVGKHSNAHCNPFGKLRFFRKNDYAILLTRRRKIRQRLHISLLIKFTCSTKGKSDRRPFNPLFGRLFPFKRCRKMA